MSVPPVAALSVFFVQDVALRAARRRHGGVFDGKLKTRLLDSLTPDVFFLALADLLDDEWGQHVSSLQGFPLGRGVSG